MSERLQVSVGAHGLAVERIGGGEPTFVCLHGLADSRRIWDAIAPALAERGTVVLVDQRGHGESDAPPGPCRREDLAQDVRALAGALGIERVILVGHSMGGIVALTVAVEHPEIVAGLVLLGTTSQVNERAAGWYEEIARAAERDGLDGLRRAIFGERSRREIRGDARAIAAITRCLASLHREPLTPRLAALRVPALVMVGEQDPMGPAASSILASAIPGARLVTIPGRGHWLHVEEPAAVVANVDALLAENFGR